MFNGSLKDDAIERLQKSEKRFNSQVKKLNKKSMELLTLRRGSSESTIQLVEDYINGLANSPKELDKSYAEYKKSYVVFNRTLEDIYIQDVDSDLTAYRSAGAGVGAGVAVAAFAPTAAMAAATTFGAASTGTAISALSGAAATNAALAWLGGGVLTAGGGGMAAGSSLLALAGPVGWTIGGAALLGTGLWKRSKNAKIAEEADEANEALLEGISEFKVAGKEVKRLLTLTEEHSDLAQDLLGALKTDAPDDYSDFSASDKGHLLALINNIKSLSVLLNKKAI